jgi:hypothetical protein
MKPIVTTRKIARLHRYIAKDSEKQAPKVTVSRLIKKLFTEALTYSNKAKDRKGIQGDHPEKGNYSVILNVSHRYDETQNYSWDTAEWKINNGKVLILEEKSQGHLDLWTHDVFIRFVTVYKQIVVGRTYVEIASTQFTDPQPM